MLNGRFQQIEAAELKGKQEILTLAKLGEPTDHGHLLAICIRLPTDYEPYGYRYRDGNDCSCGCKWFLPLEVISTDWGVCANPQSPRCGLLTFEHQGCQFFTPQPESNESADEE
jgi:hypothetical protein